MLVDNRRTRLTTHANKLKDEFENKSIEVTTFPICPSKGQRRLRNETIVSKNIEYPQHLSVYVPEYSEIELGIGFINGMGNNITNAKQHALRLSEYSKSKIHLVFDPTHGPIKDVLAAVVAKKRDANACLELVEQLLLNQWKEYFSKNGPDSKFLQICHSKGAIHVKNALKAAPQNIRERIIVTAIAPASIIVPGECYEIRNYISKNDVWLQKMHHELSPGICKHLILLEPPVLAVGNDHSFNSPTFEKKIKETIREFITTHKSSE